MLGYTGWPEGSRASTAYQEDSIQLSGCQTGGPQAFEKSDQLAHSAVPSLYSGWSSTLTCCAARQGMYARGSLQGLGDAACSKASRLMATPSRTPGTERPPPAGSAMAC